MADTTHSEAAVTEAHGHGGHGGRGAHDAKEHEKHYWKIYWILLVLLVASVVGPFIGEATGIFFITLVTAFGIAFVKAALVVKNFMHLNLEPKYVAYLFTTALALMGLFFFWVAPDVMKHEGHQWVNVAAIAATQDGAGGEAEAGPFDPAVAFATTCGACHGESGHGDGAAAAALNPRPADFTSAEFWAERDREHVVSAITGGGQAVGKSPLMPAFGAQFTEEQIAALADHVVSFRAEAPAEEPVVEVEPTEEAPTEEPPVEEAPTPDLTEAPEAPAPEAPPAPPAGMSAAEKAQRAAFITRRVHR